MEGKPNPNPQRKPNPKAAGTTEKKAPKEKSGGNKGLVIFLVIVILGLAGGLGYMITKNNQLKDEKAQQASEFSEKEDNYEKEIADLDSKVEAKIAELKKLAEERDALQLDNEDLKKSIAALEKQRNIYRNKANRSQKEVSELKALLEESKEIIAKQTEELAKQKATIDTLSLQNAMKDSTISQMTEVGAQKDEKIAIASILEAENFNITVMNDKGKVYDKQPFKSKHASILNVTFKLADNKVAEKEQKEFLLRIIEPNGTVLFDLATGGGSFQKENGKTDFYTSKQELMFDNSKQEISFVYTKGSEYEEGVYAVEIFSGGHKIGETSFEIK